MVNALGFSLLPTSLAIDSASAAFDANEARMALANQAPADGNPATAASLASMDKALSLQGVQAQVNYQVAQAMQEGARGLLKKNAEQRQRMIENGALFF